MMTNPVTGLGVISALPNMVAPAAADLGTGFSGILNNALQTVNQINGAADQQVSALLQGGKGDMSTTMIAVEKADVAFQLAMQVRNKVVNAYQDLEKMQF